MEEGERSSSSFRQGAAESWDYPFMGSACSLRPIELQQSVLTRSSDADLQAAMAFFLPRFLASFLSILYVHKENEMEEEG
jgi:hypothetical protein